ncbi:phenylalanine--tRNA ligase subunit alpha [Candidatus Gracilibacteria bacterium]|nr:phenylalanine--tRNA ligase subunit alpha [Candidatus Gracilibacteria bacterium]
MLVHRASDFEKKARDALKKIQKVEGLGVFYANFLGKKSELNDFLKSLKDLPAEEKRDIAPVIQKIRTELQNDFDAKQAFLRKKELDERLASDWLDVTKEFPIKKGSIHPISRVQRRVEEIFTSMGFEIADGPEVETEWRNFDALNVPSSHPARDMQDTFWVSSRSQDPHENTVLRTHTSSVQIRKMMEYGAPVRIIVPGRVYRNEAVDASHDATFYQVEGLLVDKGISLAHLKGTIQAMLSELFEKEVLVRFRPGYFPFVEPGLEVDFSCLLCNGKGCRVCKHSGWVEFMGAGMVHPNVLRNGGIDPEVYSGFAFGFGLTRLVMMQYGIDDIRLLFSQKKSFLSQF